MTTNTKTAHTPGPWHVAPIEGAAFNNIRAGAYSVASVYKHIGSPSTMESDGQGDANASLISAAPELLEALQVALPILELAEQAANAAQGPNVLNSKVAAIRSAIAKATA
jgi:hypothetical protein